MIAKIMETIYALHDDEIDSILCILHQDVGREGSLYCERCKCPDKLEPNWKVLYNELADTTHKYREEWKTKHVEATRNYDELSAEYEQNMSDAEDWKARHDDLVDDNNKTHDKYTELHRDTNARYDKLEKTYADLNDVHSSLSKQYNELMQDNCDRERGKASYDSPDYDAVTKGIVSLIRLLRR